MGVMVPCTYCGNDVDSTKPGTFLEITGWAENRRGGGAHAIARRKNTGRAAHSWCLDHAKTGSEQLALD